MTHNKLVSIGVLGSNKNNITYNIVKEVFIDSGYSYLYSNNIISVLNKENNFVLVFELIPEIIEKIMGLNLCLDILIHTSLREKDYKNLSVKRLAERAKYLIMNIDDENAVQILSEDIRGLVITYGLNKKATITTSSLTVSNNIQFNFCLQRELTTIKGKNLEQMEVPITMNLIGTSNIYHGLAAITCAMIYGVDIELIKESLTDFKGVYRCLEKIYGGEYIILDNCCETASDYNQIFDEIQYLKFENLYIMSGIDKNQSNEDIKDNIEVVASWQPILNIKKIFIYIEQNIALYNDIFKTSFNNLEIEFDKFSQLDICIQSAVESLEKGDMLLILGGESLNDCRTKVNQLVK